MLALVLSMACFMPASTREVVGAWTGQLAIFPIELQVAETDTGLEATVTTLQGRTTQRVYDAELSGGREVVFVGEDGDRYAMNLGWSRMEGTFSGYDRTGSLVQVPVKFQRL